MNDLTNLLSAIAKLLWPVLAFVAALVFRPQVAELIGRIRRVKAFGQELELGDSLQRLDESAGKINEKTATQPSITINASDSIAVRDQKVDDAITQILDEAGRSPKTALMLLAAQIEKEIRQLLATLGILGSRKNIGLRQGLEELASRYGGQLPGFIPAAYNDFVQARNLIVHGGNAEDKDILRAVDSGITILKGIRSLPHETYVVYRTDVDLFRDSFCRDPYKDVKGVILEVESTNSVEKIRRIYPTTQEHFKAGARVAWEWSDKNRWGAAWYADPDTNIATQAWGESIEFVGRLIDSV